MENKAIFLDRDGVINVDKGYVYKVEDVEFVNGIFDALKKVANNYRLIIVTNQSGIARGYYTESQFLDVMDFIIQKFKEHGIKIDSYYYCPHHPSAAVIEKYLRDCKCRKPKPGMLLKAAEDKGIILEESYMIGDKVSDAEVGIATGCRSILIKVDETELTNLRSSSNLEKVVVVNDIHEAVNYILSEEDN